VRVVLIHIHDITGIDGIIFCLYQASSRGRCV
jgi:hypothetical protein